MQYTENYNLKLPDTTDFYSIADFNDNATVIDGVMQATASSASANAEAISKEASRAALAEQANAEAISAEVLRAKEQETVNANAIAAETKRASGAESALQKDVDALDIKTDGFESRSTAFATDGSITEIYGDKKIVTDFVSDAQIVQKLYVNEVLTKTKTINFSADGTTITEEVA